MARMKARNDPGLEELGQFNPVFAWFEGGDRIQFGDLCSACGGPTRDECLGWRKETLDGVLAPVPKVFCQCPYFTAWDSQQLTRETLTKDELGEGERNVVECPDCGKMTLRTAVRTASEFGTRMNPRIVSLEWCECGRFDARKRQLTGDSETCGFCGRRPDADEKTVYGGGAFHISCFLRLRFFFTMGEMLRVAQSYMSTGRTLSLEESTKALEKTIAMVRAFRVTGNSHIMGINRVIHWLEGDSPVPSSMLFFRSIEALENFLVSEFATENERSVGIHILEDAYVVYNDASAVRWITHGTFKPVNSVSGLISKYIEPARRGKFDAIGQDRLTDVEDGKCIICGHISRSHRIATGEDDKNIYVCHHCWQGKPAAHK